MNQSLFQLMVRLDEPVPFPTYAYTNGNQPLKINDPVTFSTSVQTKWTKSPAVLMLRLNETGMFQIIYSDEKPVTFPNSCPDWMNHLCFNLSLDKTEPVTFFLTYA